MSTQRRPSRGGSGMFNGSQVGTVSAGAIINVCGDFLVNQPASQAEISEMVEWLSSINFRSIQKENLKKHTLGTGKWLLTDKEFNDWKRGDLKAFWITGMPGSGKTVLCAATNNALQKEFKSNPKVLFLVVFCRYDNKLTAAQIAAAMTCQILDSTDDQQVLSIVQRFYNAHKRQRTTPDLSDFVELFEEVFPLYDRVVTSIDAFDETSEEVRQELLEALAQLDVSLFITSRPSIDHFKALLPDVHSLRLESTSTLTGDIERFIRAKLSKTPRLMSIIKERPDLLEEVCIKLVGKAKGMFLLAALHIAALQNITNARQMMDIIDALPSELMAMYRDTWRRITSQDPNSFDLARRTFLWILHGEEPIEGSPTLSEAAGKLATISHFLAISIEERTYNPESLSPRDLIQAVCQGLVDFEAETSTMRLCHYTTKDFLISEDVHLQISPSPRAEIVASLLIAITSWGVSHPLQWWWEKASISLGGDAVDESNSFISYIHEIWPLHYSSMDSIEEKTATWTMLGCTTPLQPLSQYQFHIMDCASPGIVSDTIGPEHIAATFLSFEHQSLAIAGASTHSRQGYLPIHYLFFNNFNQRNDPYRVDLLTSMLDHGVDVNVPGIQGQTPLMLAALGRDEASMSALLARADCDVTRVDHRGRTALHYAPIALGLEVGVASRGDPYALPSDSLLIARCGLNCVDEDGRTPFHYISNFSYRGDISGPLMDPGEFFWELLLNHPDFDVNIQDDYGTTPLMTIIDGSSSTSDTLESLLLKPGLRVNLQDQAGATALHRLIQKPGYGWEQDGDFGWEKSGYESLKRLLEHPEVDVTIRDKNGHTALDVAIEQVSKGEIGEEGRPVSCYVPKIAVDMLKSHPSALR